MKQTKKTLAVAISAVLAVSMSTVSFAEDADEEKASGVETLVITASKRAESLQESGISVTALSETELQRMGAEELLDFAVKVPNLGMAYEADGRFDSSSPSIRGVFGVNTTGFYLDDTPVSASILPRVMDVQRIEVLRGPQGSLYGAKSMGGTIRMITVQPDLGNPEGSIVVKGSSVTDGDTNSSFEGSFNIPIVEDQFAVRGTFYYGQNSGIFDRVYQSSWVEGGSGDVRQSPGPAFDKVENVDDETYWGGQLTGLIQITDNLTFSPKYMFQKIEADGLPFADITSDNTTRMRFFNEEEPGTDDWTVFSGTFNWDTDAGKLTSVTSWYDRTTDETEEEATFLHWLFNNVIEIPIDPIVSMLSTVEKYESLVHETRFSTDNDGNFNYTVGVFYSDGEWDHEYPRAVQTGLADALDAFVGEEGFGQAAFGLSDDDLIFATETLTQVKETAIFGEVTYDFNDIYSLTAGGRFYKTEVEAVNWADGFANSGPSSYPDVGEEATQSDTGFNPKLMLQAKIDEDINFYASAGKGFRTGGINGNLPLGLCGDELEEIGIDPASSRSYDSDELWSYEAGVKTSLADNTVTLNGTVFMIDWTNIQQLLRLGCGFQTTQNAGEAESTGFELELNAVPMEGLNLSFGVGYTNAEITDHGNAPGVSVGDKIQGVPDWTYNGSAQYMFEVSDGWEMLLRADANHYGESFSTNNGEPRERDAWSAVNMRAGLFNDTYEITLFIDNATDERVNLADSRSIAAETPGRPRLVVNRPRTVGLEVRMRF